jgi:predicted transcriptional regulator
MKKTQREAKAMWKLTVRLDDDLAERLKERADKERRTLQTVVTVAIEQYLTTPLKGGSL